MEKLIWVDKVSKVYNFITHLENKVHDKIDPVADIVGNNVVLKGIVILLLFLILPILALFPLSMLIVCRSATTLGKLLKRPLIADYMQYRSYDSYDVNELTYLQYVWIDTNMDSIEWEGVGWYGAYHSESGRGLRVRQELNALIEGNS